MPFSSSLAQFNADYLRLTCEVAECRENHDLTDSMVIGTSAIVDTEIDGAHAGRFLQSLQENIFEIRKRR